MTEFTYETPDLKAFLYTLRRYLETINQSEIAVKS